MAANKTRMGKRKIEAVSLEKTGSKVKKTKEVTKSSKPLTKEGLQNELKKVQEENKILQEENISLAQENKKNIESICILEETIQLMEKKDKSSKEKTSASVQTDDYDQALMRCNECQYPAEDIYDLGEHMYEFHSDQASETCESDNIACHYCGDKFSTKGDLMIHRKEAHKEKVNQCRYFTAGNCVFGDESCWYSHSRSNTDTSLSEFKCTICEKSFKIRSDFMHHRKEDHIKNVPICIDSVNGICRFGTGNCWYNHNEMKMINQNQNTQNSIFQNQAVIEKLFDMMEKFTQHVVQNGNNI